MDERIKRIENFTKIKIDPESKDYTYDSQKFSQENLEKYKQKLHGEKPLYNSHDKLCYERSDEIQPSLTQEEALKNTKYKKDNYFQVIKPF